MKRIISYILMSIVTLNVFAYYGTIYTPNGSSIEVMYLTEMSADEISNNNYYYRQLFPNATLIGNTSATYNCHSYAWNMVHGGPTCWINQFTSLGNINIAKYWVDGSYIRVMEEDATIVHYYESDHSAIVKSSDRSKYISKWGAMPLMEHAPEYGPYNNMDKRHYYSHLSNFETHILAPGYGDYITRREYEFFTLEDPDDRYMYIWTIYEEQDDGQDAVELGKATLEHRDSESMAYITFLRSGLYTISVDIYTGDDEFVCRYMCQANVL